MRTIHIDQREWVYFIIGLVVAALGCMWMFSYHRNGGSGQEIGESSVESAKFIDGWEHEKDETYATYYMRKIEVSIKGKVESGKLYMRFLKKDGTLLDHREFVAGDVVDVKRTFTGLKEDCICVEYGFTKGFDGDIEYFIERYCFGYDYLNRLIN